jgi:putative aldouronate transport system permease protein
MVIKETRSDRVFNAINVFILSLILIIVAYPLYFVVIASFSNPSLVLSGKVMFYPREVSFEGYRMVWNYSALWLGYRNTIFYASVGTLINLSITLPAAYALTKKDLRFKKFLIWLFMIPMFFGGGLIPTFLMITRTLNLGDTIWAILLPGATGMMQMVIARTFFQSTIPDELHEAAEIDGASQFRVFFTIVIPLSTAIIAVQGLQAAVGHWNAFFNAFLYLSDMNARHLQPLSMVLRRILVIAQANMIADEIMADQMDFAERFRRAEQIKYAIIIVSVIPILAVYPFVQRYFVKGVMIGAIKG